jgi:hypothetical protein
MNSKPSIFSVTDLQGGGFHACFLFRCKPKHRPLLVRNLFQGKNKPDVQTLQGILQSPVIEDVPVENVRFVLPQHIDLITTEPTGPQTNDLYVTTEGRARFFDGTRWIDIPYNVNLNSASGIGTNFIKVQRLGSLSVTCPICHTKVVYESQKDFPLEDVQCQCQNGWLIKWKNAAEDDYDDAEWEVDWPERNLWDHVREDNEMPNL